MKELKTIVGAYERWKLLGHRMALATVVKVEGSAYRKEGARMLVTDQGAWVGAISGGCLEGYILEYCQQVFEHGKPLLIAYDSEKEEDKINGIGLGCNGKITFLIEEINGKDAQNHVELLKIVLGIRKTFILQIQYAYIHLEVTYQLQLLDTLAGALPNGIAHTPVDSDCFQKVVAQQQTRTWELATDSYVLYEYLQPPVQLIVAGGGNDVIPLVEMANLMGWEVTVLDRRAEFADSSRFVPACRVVHAQVQEMLDNVIVDEHTAIALMTHNFYCDQWLLQATYTSEAFYIGLLGPRKKFSRLTKELQEKGVEIHSEQLPQVYNPVGLDIGAESAEEIALAIIAEIQAVRKKREGRSLKWKNANAEAAIG